MDNNKMNDEVIRVKFEHIYDALDNIGKQTNILKDTIHKFELTTSNSITELKTKLMIYVTAITGVTSVVVGYLMTHIS